MQEKTKRQTILIVDDSAETIDVLDETLNRDYEVLVALSGSDALKLLEREDSVDLVLLDVVMPEMDGYEVCRRLKSEVSTRDIPVLFISALDETRDLVRAFETGGVDYINKPFHAQEVKARVRTQLALRLMQRKILEQNRELADMNAALTEANRCQEEINKELRAAFAQVKQLSGLLPICASCKKIRDDTGNWQQIEAYIRDRSEAEFTHGICPQCANKAYEELERLKRSETGSFK